MFDCPPFCLKTNICWSFSCSNPPRPPTPLSLSACLSLSLADPHSAEGGGGFSGSGASYWPRISWSPAVPALPLTHFPGCSGRSQASSTSGGESGLWLQCSSLIGHWTSLQCSSLIGRWASHSWPPDWIPQLFLFKSLRAAMNHNTGRRRESQGL